MSDREQIASKHEAEMLIERMALAMTFEEIKEVLEDVLQNQFKREFSIEGKA